MVEVQPNIFLYNEVHTFSASGLFILHLETLFILIKNVTNINVACVVDTKLFFYGMILL